MEQFPHKTLEDKDLAIKLLMPLIPYKTEMTDVVRVLASRVISLEERIQKLESSPQHRISDDVKRLNFLKKVLAFIFLK